jgi:tetratricopeptide (TPR) repeat protein
MKILLKILLIAIIATSFTLATNAQEEKYKALNKKMVTLYKSGRTLDAIEIAKQALLVAEETFGKKHPYVSTSLNNMALLYIADGKYEKAEELYERSLKLAEELLGRDNPQLAGILENMVKCNEKLGKTEKAEMLEARLDDLREQ